ncbi:MAG: AraC family transcriptional regulator [Ruminococcaceae bacterium]|nr:AraC family transcriptional regulator [Oscillospiraceae bacterium]
MSVKSNPLDKEKLNMIIVPDCVSQINKVTQSRRMLHEEIEIKYFYEGTATLLIGTETVTARAGDVVVMNPYQFHATIDCAETVGKYHTLMIPLDFFSGSGVEELELRSLLLAKGQVFCTFFPKDKRLGNIIERIVIEYKEKKPAFRVAIKGLVTELFAIILRNGLISGETTSQSNDILHMYELVEPALNHIRNNYPDDMTVEYLAELCKVSKYYFCRIFKIVTKKSAMEYLRDYRIDVADILLANTDKSVTQIAQACGFGDVNYFCRCYKIQYGISPGKRKNRT